MRSCGFLHALHDGKGLPGRTTTVQLRAFGSACFREETPNYRAVRLPNGRELLLQEIDPIGRQGAPDVFSFGVEAAPCSHLPDDRGAEGSERSSPLFCPQMLYPWLLSVEQFVGHSEQLSPCLCVPSLLANLSPASLFVDPVLTWQ
jgi:hypothetical protein